MNKAYKVIYNESTSTYVAVSELETSKGKATSISDNSTVVQAETSKSLTGRFMLGKLALSVLGLSTLFAMPLAHASWVNNSGGGTGSTGAINTTGNFGTASATGIAIGSGNAASGGQASASGENAIAIGAGSKSGALNTIAIGCTGQAAQDTFI